MQWFTGSYVAFKVHADLLIKENKVSDGECTFVNGTMISYGKNRVLIIDMYGAIIGESKKVIIKVGCQANFFIMFEDNP